MTINQNGIKVKWDPKATGQRIRNLRGPLTQSELAKRIGCNQVDISRAERGIRPPSIELLLALALSFSVSVDYLLTGAQDGVAAEASPVYGNSYELLFIGNLDSPSKRAIRQLARLLSSRSAS
ncbi:MAG: helix-turn-helix transcriptional regulator [Nitrospiraceae bacterium]|nr:helix-turn-helix transcriptional regulator [Nitrospiraceae bacterium]